jgi:NADH-quinone oxidoreductase subunit A
MLPFPAYVPIFILIGLAITFAALVTILTFILGPKKPSPAKLAPYESGIREIEPLKRRFPVKYLVTGMLFIIFDIEAVAFYPLAVLLKNNLKVFGLIELVIFVAILLIAYIYVWRKGAFQWE